MRYYKYFDKSQIKVCLFDDLMSNTGLFMSELYSFLNIDDDVKNKDYCLYNQTGVLKSTLLINSIKKLGFLKSRLKFLFPYLINIRYFRKSLLHKPTLKKEFRKYLINYYRDDIKDLEGLIEKDLSSWLY